VIRGIQGHYSLNPKWLTYLTLGYTGIIDVSNPLKHSRVQTLKQEVQLMMLASFKYDKTIVLSANTDKLIKNTYDRFVDSLKEEPFVQLFYKASRPIIAFKVEDELSHKSFYYVTNAEIMKGVNPTVKMKLRRTSTKPDIVSTKMAKDIREMVDDKGNERIMNMRELSLELDNQKVQLIKDC